MSKYDPLEKYLKTKGYTNIPMSFSEIESVIGRALPPSARRHRAWWSNNPSNSVITYAWLAAGYKTSAVNLEAEKLVFRKADDLQHAPQRGAAVPAASGRGDAHPLLGCMKATVTFTADIDLSQPADPDWADIAESAGPSHG